MSNPPHLPVEIQEMIWSSSSRNLLASCCRLSKHHDQVLRNALWQKIQLSELKESELFLECLAGLDKESRDRFMECVKELEMSSEEPGCEQSFMAFQLFESEDWELFKKLETLKLTAVVIPKDDFGEQCGGWSATLSQLKGLKSLVLKEIILGDEDICLETPSWPELTSLKLFDVTYDDCVEPEDGDHFLDSAAVPKLQHLSICNGIGAQMLMELYLPLSPQIQTLSVPSFELIGESEESDEAECCLALFTELTTLHLSSWDLDVINFISTLPKLQHLLLETTVDRMKVRDGQDPDAILAEMIEFFTKSRKAWVKNTKITISRSAESTIDYTKLEKVLKKKGITFVVGVNAEEWVEEFKMKE